MCQVIARHLHIQEYFGLGGNGQCPFVLDATLYVCGEIGASVSVLISMCQAPPRGLFPTPTQYERLTEQKDPGRLLRPRNSSSVCTCSCRNIYRRDSGYRLMSNFDKYSIGCPGRDYSLTIFVSAERNFELMPQEVRRWEELGKSLYHWTRHLQGRRHFGNPFQECMFRLTVIWGQHGQYEGE